MLISRQKGCKMDKELKDCCLDIIDVFRKQGENIMFLEKCGGLQIFNNKTVYQVMQGPSENYECPDTAIQHVWIESGRDFMDFMKGVFK